MVNVADKRFLCFGAVLILFFLGIFWEKVLLYFMYDAPVTDYEYGPSDNDFSYIPAKKVSQEVEVSTDPITSIYMNYNEVPGFHHWLHYGKAYYENIMHLDKREGSVKMLEIGVQSGGSSRLWKQLFKEKLDYVGVDINPNCKQFEKPEEHIKIEIGSQLDEPFLKKICKTYGPFDFILDDGGHSTEMIMTTLNVLWYCLEDQGVYAVEDTHAHIMRDPASSSMVFAGHGLSYHFGQILGRMERYYSNHVFNSGKWLADPDNFAKHIQKAVKYDSILFLHYREKFQPAVEISKGDKFIPYKLRRQ